MSEINDRLALNSTKTWHKVEGWKEKEKEDHQKPKTETSGLSLANRVRNRAIETFGVTKLPPVLIRINSNANTKLVANDGVQWYYNLTTPITGYNFCSVLYFGWFGWYAADNLGTEPIAVGINIQEFNGATNNQTIGNEAYIPSFLIPFDLPNMSGTGVSGTAPGDADALTFVERYKHQVFCEIPNNYVFYTHYTFNEFIWSFSNWINF